MPRARTSTVLATACILLTACATGQSSSVSVPGGGIYVPPPGGGGGGGGNGTTTLPAPTGGGLYYDTGRSGPVGVPAPASFGPAPAPAQQPTPGGASFTGPFPANVTFPALSTSLQFTSTGLSAVAPDQGATVTVVSMSSVARTLQVVVPSLNINATIFQNNADLNPDEGVTTNLNYVVLGTWGTGTSERQAWVAPSWQKDVTQFAFGYETPSGAMPVSGTAAFTGSAYANVFRSDATISAAIMLGRASFSVDFSSGNISGAFNNWQQSGPWNPAGTPSFLPWNDVSINSSIAAGTSRFSGTTAVTSNPGTMFSLGSSATGHIVGGFYGPAAEEIGAVWTLSDGTSSALGGVLGRR